MWEEVLQFQMKGPALQSNIDYNHDNGFYAGIWGSNIDNPADPDQNLELDAYTGVTKGYKGFDFTLGGIYYAFLGAQNSQDTDYYEVQTAVTKDFDVAAVTGSVFYSPDFTNNSGHAEYYIAQLEIPLLKNFSLIDKPVSETIKAVETPFRRYALLSQSYGYISNLIGLTASVGRQEIENNTNFGMPDYTDWSVGAQFALEGFNLALTYMDTNIDKNACSDGCDERVVFSLSKSF